MKLHLNVYMLCSIKKKTSFLATVNVSLTKCFALFVEGWKGSLKQKKIRVNKYKNTEARNKLQTME